MASKQGDGQFTEEERAAMRERAAEAKAAKKGAGRAEGEAALLEKIAQMPEAERAMAARIHAIVADVAPGLAPKTWYGMPAWADANGKAVCFFQPASKFKARYSTLGFNDSARLDDGAMWSTSFAVVELTTEVEARIAELVATAASA
jgi:uncharacterized protein YdhG (YjbR/CyaY superfamily)